MVVTPYYPGYLGGVPVRTFDASWVHTIGRGNGADGYSFVFGDLREVTDPFGEMGVGDGLVVRFRTRAFFTDKSGCEDETCDAWNQGYGLLQARTRGTPAPAARSPRYTLTTLCTLCTLCTLSPLLARLRSCTTARCSTRRTCWTS